MLRACFLGLFGLCLVYSICAQVNPMGKPQATRSTQSIEDEIIETAVAATSRNLKGFAKEHTSSNSITGKLAELASKYSSVFDILPAILTTNIKLLEAVDEWYGTRYRFGGTGKSGIDCSAFVRAVYKMAFGITLPRTAREQFRVSEAKISKSELKQGDLVFFNTTGGISHVGVYLGNNRFAHASSSKGVTVNGLDEKYFASRYLGARRLELDNSL